MDRFEIASMLHFRLVSQTLGLKAALWPVMCVAALGSSACSSLDPTTDECEDVQSCRVQIPDEPPPPPPDSGTQEDPTTSAWGCLDVPHLPDSPVPDVVLFAMAVVDFNNPAPIALPGLNVEVCQIQDFSCARPLTGRPPEIPPQVQVMQNIPGQPPPLFLVGLPTNAELPLYLRLSAPNYLNTEYYFLNELRLNLDGEAMGDNPGPIVRGETITLPRRESIGDFFQRTGGNRDETAGIVALRTFDCQGRRAAGVSIEIIGDDTEGPEFPWVFNAGAPTPGTLTDEQGVAGFANVPNLPARINLRGRTPDGRPYGQVTVDVRPDTLTFAEVRPAGAYLRAPRPD